MTRNSRQDQRDLSGFSFCKAITEFPSKLTGIEAEMHQEGLKEAKGLGKSPSGLSIPFAVMTHRGLTVGTDNQGGYTVATDLKPGSFIELLQNKIVCKSMGATVLDGLTGDIAIPIQATGATAVWEGEIDAAAESSPTFGQLALAPKRVGTYSELSKQLLVQSSLGVENIIQNQLADSIAQAIDYAALHGTGSNNQPTGIAATSGIGSVVGGTDGAIPDRADIIALETAVAVANADVGALGYLTNSKLKAVLKQIYTNATYGEKPLWADDRMNDYPAVVSNQVSSTLTKGSASEICSALFFGNWSDLVLAFFGGLDIVIDPYSLATTNKTRVTVNALVDVGVKHPASFAMMADCLLS